MKKLLAALIALTIVSTPAIAEETITTYSPREIKVTYSPSSESLVSAWGDPHEKDGHWGEPHVNLMDVSKIRMLAKTKDGKLVEIEFIPSAVNELDKASPKIWAPLLDGSTPKLQELDKSTPNLQENGIDASTPKL